MALISPILRNCSDGGYTFWCPGCDSAHHLDPRWSYNGNASAPTFKPSLNVTWGHYVTGMQDRPCLCKGSDPDADGTFWSCGQCHSFITDGKIQFLNDCTHHLKGQTVAIPEWPRPNWHDG